MERHFEADLQELRERLLVMGSVAETMIHKSVTALVSRQESLVQEVLAHEEEMDLLCIEIDDRCFTLPRSPRSSRSSTSPAWPGWPRRWSGRAWTRSSGATPSWRAP
jgi:phosphate uptake regulator